MENGICILRDGGHFLNPQIVVANKNIKLIVQNRNRKPEKK
jgi:hypothetical protein